MKGIFTILFVSVFCLNVAFAQSADKQDEAKITDVEAKEAKEIARKFTSRFLETQDLSMLFEEFYFKDFVDRFRKDQIKDDTKSTNAYFAPGITYSHKLLHESSSEDWQNFYSSSHSFIILGLVSVFKDAEQNPDKKFNPTASDLYSASVISLLEKNPNLANVIERSESSPPISSREEMRNATKTFEESLKIVRENLVDFIPAKLNNKNLTKVIELEYFKPRLVVNDSTFFELPKNTRVIFINTPIGLKLILSKDKDKLKVVWATMSLD